MSSEPLEPHIAYAAQMAGMDQELLEHILPCEEPFCREMKKVLLYLADLLESYGV
jgi:hypothetical protein